MVNIQNLIDDFKCFETARELRWPDGVNCPHSDSVAITKQGQDSTQTEPQRYRCRSCQKHFDDLTGTVFAGHHQPLWVRILCLDFLGPNLSNEQVGYELNLDPDDARKMATQLREGIDECKPAEVLGGEGKCDEVYVADGHREHPGAVKIGRHPADDGRRVHARLTRWGYSHRTVCHAAGEFARDEDGDGFREVHVNTIKGFWSLSRSWLCPNRGGSREKLPLYLGLFESVHECSNAGEGFAGSVDQPHRATHGQIPGRTASRSGPCRADA